MIGGHPGVMDHGRSLVVWPEALEHAAGRRALTEVVPLGARLLFLGPIGDLEAALDMVLPWRPLAVMTVHGQTVPPATAVVRIDRWSPDDLTGAQEVQRRSGITPLPPHTLRLGNPVDPWRHWIVPEARAGVAGVIHQQSLRRPLDDAWPPGSVLTAGLAVADGRRGEGLGAALLATAAGVGATCAVAFVDPENGTRRMLERCGWKDSGRAVHLVCWR